MVSGSLIYLHWSGHWPSCCLWAEKLLTSESHKAPTTNLSKGWCPGIGHPVRCFMITTQGDVCILNLHKYTWLSECIYREFSLWIIWTCWKRKRGKSWCREGCAHHYLVTYLGFWEMRRCFLMSPKLFLKPLPHLCSLPYKNALLMGTIQIIFSGKSFIIYNWWTGWVVFIFNNNDFWFFLEEGVTTGEPWSMQISHRRRVSLCFYVVSGNRWLPILESVLGFTSHWFWQMQTKNVFRQLGIIVFIHL